MYYSDRDDFLLANQRSLGLNFLYENEATTHSNSYFCIFFPYLEKGLTFELWGITSLYLVVDHKVLKDVMLHFSILLQHIILRCQYSMLVK